ncbi:tRNA dihydrouridine(16) synthase DusC [Exilibacterium tricleocarpae]|uniref:tRNA-dihydrouridine(16) synthase n=1 Tax=Exilibacterium tricleocarpae TaxID=2591008 RepID=A0A545SP15_9GAMM|nr:tRNA-dihydrouridine synthase [Exilibacterium tricleocarpae]TQV66697.1 tRNA dihydrouridine(16) synthase DusC [Exilibacterium tricleocarpae]
MRIFLAPMEGVVDQHVRALLTDLGGIDGCVTEFVRVTDHLLPEKVFRRYCPELQTDCRTPSGTPVRIQLLGGKPGPMAANAARAAALGAATIDLNFGCPAKTVNKNDGGARLLQQPERVGGIVAAVRNAVPKSTQVTAKIRLGFEDKSRYLDNALAVFEAGADELVVHARSKKDGYRPPAYWEYIGSIRENIAIPVIANGEIWSVSDYRRCRQLSGCEDVMLGRGLLACPDLARQIKTAAGTANCTPLTWGRICQLLFDYYLQTKALYPGKFLGNRVKQWLVYLRLRYPQAIEFFEAIKRHRDAAAIESVFQRHLQAFQT